LTPEELYLISLANKNLKAILSETQPFSQKSLRDKLGMVQSETSRCVHILLDRKLIKISHGNVHDLRKKSIFYTTIYDKFTYEAKTDKITLTRRKDNA